MEDGQFMHLPDGRDHLKPRPSSIPFTRRKAPPTHRRLDQGE